MREKCIVSVRDEDGIPVEFCQADFEYISENVSRETVLKADMNGIINLERPNVEEVTAYMGFKVEYQDDSEKAELRMVSNETGIYAVCDLKKAAETIVSHMNSSGISQSLFEEPYFKSCMNALSKKDIKDEPFQIQLENGRADLYGRGRIETGGVMNYCAAAFSRIRIELSGGEPAEVTLLDCVAADRDLNNLEDPVCRFITNNGRTLKLRPKEIRRNGNTCRRIFSCSIKSDFLYTDVAFPDNWQDREIFYDILTDNEEEYIRAKGMLIARGGDRENMLARELISHLVASRQGMKKEYNA